jgi:hypothetical protein
MELPEALALLESAEHSPGFAIPSLPGVYVFDDGYRTLYVGESRNLKRRLLRHERGYLRRSTGVRCRVIPCTNHKQVERWLIAELRPSLNGVSEWRRKCKPTKTEGEIARFMAELFVVVEASRK